MLCVLSAVKSFESRSLSRMKTQISPMLAVSDGNAAIAFYKAAFGATVLWHLDGGGHIVAGLEIDGAPFSSAT